MNNLFFIEARCEKTNKPFYIRYDLAADGVWCITRGVTTIPYGQNPGSLGSGDVDVSSARTGPQYRCPYCGNGNFVRHGKCGKFTCMPDNTDDFRCAYCNERGKITGTIEKLDKVRFDKGQ